MLLSTVELPHNVMIVDTSAYEREMFSAGLRGTMQDAKSGKPRTAGSTLSLENLLRSLKIEPSRMCMLHNAGNDAMMSLVAFQMLVDQSSMTLPTPRHNALAMRSSSRSPMPSLNMPLPTYTVPAASYGVYLTPSPSHSPMDGSPRNSMYFNASSNSPRRKSWVPDELGARRNSPSDGLEAATWK
jgi:hypothetical protein